MAIPWTDNPGGFFKRLGVLGGYLSEARTHQNATLATRLTSLVNQLTINSTGAGITSEPDLADDLPRSFDTGKSGAGSNLSDLKRLAEEIVTRMVYRDNPQRSRTTLKVALEEAIRQMGVATTVRVSACTVSASAGSINTVASTAPNGVVVLSVKRGDGRQQDNLFAEVGRLVCTGDGYAGTATAAAEPFTFEGDEAQTSPLHWEWPLGSGANASMSAADAAQDVASGNLLFNSDWETWASGAPSYWTVTDAQTQLTQETTTFFDGANAIKLAGHATGTPQLTQVFNDSTNGTSTVLKPEVPYACNLWIRTDLVPAAGVLTVDLIDGSNVVINDQQAVANSFTKTLSTLTVNTWTAVNGVFRLPRVLPSTIKIRVRLSTAMSAGSNLYLDRCGMATMTRLYAGGPYMAIFSGNVPFVTGDWFAITMANDRAGASNLNTWQTLFDRLFDMRALDLLLPTSGTTLINDSLIA